MLSSAVIFLPLLSFGEQVVHDAIYFCLESFKAHLQMESDDHRGYSQVKNEYAHVVVNHSQDQYVNGAFHTNGIENFWSLFKRGIIGIYHQVSHKHLQAYVDEFAYRFNNRGINDQLRFTETLTKTRGRLKYKDLTAKRGQ